MWKLIRIYFNSDEDSVQNGFKIVRHLENEFGLKELYFAHYNEGLGPYIQIWADSSVLDDARVENVVKQYNCVISKDIKETKPDPLSYAYVLAYSLCKELYNLDQTKKTDNLYELFHFTQNMLSFSRPDEADNYCNWSLRIRNIH